MGKPGLRKVHHYSVEFKLTAVKTERFAFIDTLRERFRVSRMCALYGVTRAGYYAWHRRGPSARQRQDRVVLEQIQATFARSRGTYGSPRIHHALAAAGVRVSARRVARLMREAGVRARVRKLYRRIPGLHGFFTSIPNRQLDRLATATDQAWVADITYLRVAGACDTSPS